MTARCRKCGTPNQTGRLCSQCELEERYSNCRECGRITSQIELCTNCQDGDSQ